MAGFDVVYQQVLEGLTESPIVSGLAILVIFALIQDFFLFRRLRRLVRGGDGKTLEGTIRKLNERVSELESHAVRTTGALDAHDKRLTTAVRNVSVKRFDPFGAAGGQQSFASALLNEKGDGVVISGIHTRDGVRVYAKEVSNFRSERELSDEERSAIEETRKKLSN